MPLDIKYIPATYFQEYLVDKDTGLPLAAGTITTYKDDARTELKPMYRITGTPPNYSYVELPNPLTLSSIGTIQDGVGNDINPYFYPYDADGNIELYYIEVENAGAIPQWTREGVPNVSAPEEEAEDFTNYVTNGQFAVHNAIAATSTAEEGLVTTDTTQVAPGNWAFIRPFASTASDYILFNRFDSPTVNPPGSPRYEIQLKNIVPSVGDAYKWLYVYFPNVNTFASDTDVYTLSFTAKSITTSSIDILYYKYYGAGGDSPDTISLRTIALTDSYATYNTSIIFGNNDGKTLGAANDDYLSIVISLPTSAVFDVELTDFVLTKGLYSISSYPITTDADVKARALAGTIPTPDYEGKNLYLPTVMGLNGLEYDHSQIGQIMFYPINYVENTNLYIPPSKGLIKALGQTFVVADYDTTWRIPYRRIFERLVWDEQTNYTFFGAGVTKVTGEYQSSGVFDIVGNDPATTYPVVTDGTLATGFTFTPISPTPFRTRITTVAASLITPGAYFKYGSEISEGQNYVLWFEVGGTGAKPSVPGTTLYQKAVLTGTETADEVAYVTIRAINSMFVAMPDLRGFFVRCQDLGAGRDPDAAARQPLTSGSIVTGDNPGTVQNFENYYHTHAATTTIHVDYNNGNPSSWLTKDGVGTAFGYLDGSCTGIYTLEPFQLLDMNPAATTTTVAADGGSETRPLNINLTGYIRI